MTEAIDKTQEQRQRRYKWLVAGGVFGIVSALAFDNKFIFGIGYFANLNGPVGFYPLWAVAVMPIFFYFSKRLEKKTALIAFFSGASFTLGIASITLYTLSMFGIEIGQLIVRAYT